MEQEDNARFENYLQMASGDGIHDQVSGMGEVDEISSHMGGKFEEHEDHDEGEWKYIREEQQSEKQQQQQQQILKAAIDGKDVMEGMDIGFGMGTGTGTGIGIGNGNGHDVHAGADDMLLLGQHEVGNGVVNVNVAADVGTDIIANAAGVDESEEGEVEIIKNDGDFSTTSNTTSTAGEDAEVDAGVLQVEMKIEAAPTAQLLTEHADNMETHLMSSIGTGAETEEEEPSSLATNTTNGTNSLSENAPHQLQSTQVEHEPFDGNISVEDKENTDPLISGVSDAFELTRPTDLDFELHSHLNPNAMEFVPSFGSNPTSPVTTAPVSGMATFGAEEHVGEPASNAVEATETAASIESQQEQQPHPNALPRHLLGSDEFVAQSPRKGRGDTDLDCITLPGEIEFEHEAAKRPHQLEKEGDLIGDSVDQLEQQFLLDQLENGCEDDAHIMETNAVAEKDCLDYQRQSPASFIDHGPETCVDLDADADVQPIMEEKPLQQMCEKTGESIEHLLNTVQPLPIDSESLNVSFIEESLSQQEDVAAGKELLDIEEKENISHSPSTEEMQMNLRNELHNSAKDIPQIPIDMDNAAHMQESFYLEHTSSEIQQIDEEQNIEEQHSPSDEPAIYDTDDTTIPTKCDVSHEENSVEEMRAELESAAQAELEIDPTAAAKSLNIFAPEFTPTQKLTEGASDMLTPSPLSTEEKHLVEETKEQASSNDTLDELEQKMDDTIQSARDGFLSQVEEVAQTAADIVENLNPFAVPESEVQLSELNAFNTLQEEPLHSDASQNEQLFSNEISSQEQEQEQEQEQVQVQMQEQEQEPEPKSEQEQEHHEAIASELNYNADLLPSQPDDHYSPTKYELDETVAMESVPAQMSVEPSFVAAPGSYWPEPAMHEDFEASHLPIDEPIASMVEFIAPTVELIEPLVEPVAPVVEPIAAEVKPVATEVEPVAPEVEPVTAEVEPVAVEVEPVTTAVELPSAEVKTADDSIPVVATVAAVGAVAATAAAVAASTGKAGSKKPAAARTPTSAKPKLGDAKKIAEPAKKPPRPSTAPIKSTTASSTEKKTLASSTTARLSTVARKPLTTTTAKPTTTARPTTAPAVSKTNTTKAIASSPSAAKTLGATKTTVPSKTTTTARTNTTNSTVRRSAPAATTTTTSKPKTTTSAPTKPTTLGISSIANKTKVSSPRTTLTSQLRKIGPPTATTAAKSPMKSTASNMNGGTSSTTTSATHRAKTSSGTNATNTTVAKTFTARPAPKTTHVTMTTTHTVRRTTGGTTNSTITTTTKTSSSTAPKRTPPNTKSTVGGKSVLSPTKTPTTASKLKAKEVTKKITPIKSTNTQKQTSDETKMNGANAGQGESELELENENENVSAQLQPQMNGGGDGGEKLENGTHHAGLESIGDYQLEQNVSLIDA